MFSELLKNLTKSSSPFDNIKNVFDYVVNGTTGGEKTSSGSSSKGGFASYFKKSPSADAVVKIPLKIALNGGAVKIDGLPGGNRPINIPANTANNSINVNPFFIFIPPIFTLHFYYTIWIIKIQEKKRNNYYQVFFSTFNIKKLK